MGHYASEMGVEDKFVPSKECLEAQQKHDARIDTICMEGIRLMAQGKSLFKSAKNTEQQVQADAAGKPHSLT